MSILDNTIEQGLTISKIWDIKVLWCKYSDQLKLQSELTKALDENEKWLYLFEDPLWDFKELFVLIKSLLPPQALGLSGIQYRGIIDINEGFSIHILNAAGPITKIKFKRRENKL